MWYTLVKIKEEHKEGNKMIEMLMETYNLSREEVIEVLFAE